ncbi:putative ferric reductase [Roseibium hamelinense]|uniref:Putative ferric reductase n=1 Tax=Roseibium hamelinense TaxID=150831 RepID=A0A562T937_9HYPH|nr:ferredoxin reductase family protein [Roseibium hamelinense]MTI45504.1 hypothetical protein [Roseibium hamelinense]TWI90121.1 putative ferric reductase [Roseibium hamelinense]
MNGIALSGLYLFVVLIPLGLAMAGMREPRGFWDEAASGMGMLAFAILLAEFLLSGRFKAMSGGVGMDITMRFHQLLARSCLVLAILHPFFYQTPFGRALPYDPTRQLTLAEPGLALATGAAAWVLLPAFVLLSLARDKVFKTYEGWRWTHGLGAALIAFLAWHHTVYAGRYAQDPALAAVWTGLLAIALASLLSVYLVRPLLQRARPWRVASVEKVADRTWEAVLKPEGHKGLEFRAGQFGWINMGHSPFSLAENPFSIASAPAESGVLRFIIKELGDFTNTIGNVPPGTIAYVDGPFGNLTIDGIKATGHALIAGGVGIAPMLSILRQLEAERDDRPVIVVYGNRIADQIVAGAELRSLCSKDNRHLVQCLSEPPEGWAGETGMLDGALVRRVFGSTPDPDWLYILCGPPAMMSGVEVALIGLGVPSDRILLERFTYD